LPPESFQCSYDSEGVVASWNDTGEGCDPKYGGDLEIDVIYMLDCTDDSRDTAGTYRVEFDLDTDPDAVWHFECAADVCDADGSWEDINAAIGAEMDAFFALLCSPSDVVVGDGTQWALSEDSKTGNYNGIFADVKSLCPGRFSGPQNHAKVGDACQSAL
jgi:hypothetical protein